MGHVSWHCDAHVDLSPDSVFAWLTDFSHDDHGSEAYRRGAGIDPRKARKPSSRKVLSRAGDVLRIEDSWDGSTFVSTVTLDPIARTVRIEGGYGYASTWRAAPEGSGTRLSVDGAMGRGILGSLMRLFEGKVQKSMRSDFDGHLEDLRTSRPAPARP